jgi:hypothetical protein
MSSPTFKGGPWAVRHAPLLPPGRESTLGGNRENRWRERHTVFCLRYRPPPASMAAGAPNSVSRTLGTCNIDAPSKPLSSTIDNGRMLLRQLMGLQNSLTGSYPASIPPSPPLPANPGFRCWSRIRRPPLLQPFAAGDFSLEGPIRRHAVFPSQSTRPIGGA